MAVEALGVVPEALEVPVATVVLVLPLLVLPLLVLPLLVLPLLVLPLLVPEVPLEVPEPPSVPSDP